jgi:CBS domain-containing protein
MRPTTSPTPPLAARLVSDVMRPGIISCGPETPLVEVARLMAAHRVHCVIVSGLSQDAAGTHLSWGVVSDLDLVRAAGAGEQVTAARAGATEVVTVAPSDSLDGAAQVMGEHDTAHLVVVDERGQPVGVLSTLDVAGALAGREA